MEALSVWAKVGFLENIYISHHLDQSTIDVGYVCFIQSIYQNHTNSKFNADDTIISCNTKLYGYWM